MRRAMWIAGAFALLGCGSDAAGGATGAATGATASTTSTGVGGAGGGGAAAGGAGGAGGASSTSGGGGGATAAGGAGGAASIDAFHATAAASICGALFRCCDGASQEDYFATYLADTRLASFAAKLPPAKALASEAECAAVVAEMIAITPFGDWVAQAKAGAVTFDEAAFGACRAALDGAACGAPVGAALGDSTCLGFAAPLGGTHQRSMFHRTAGPGVACVPIRDGIGSAFFGTCDPTQAFCCFEDPAKPGACALPFEGSGEPRSGTCKAAGAVGDACEMVGDVRFCRTGLACDGDTSQCVAGADAPLSVGDACIDAKWNLLGDCQQSYCDVLGTGLCEPLKKDGEACTAPYECVAGDCVQAKCAPSSFCKGAP